MLVPLLTLTAWIGIGIMVAGGALVLLSLLGAVIAILTGVIVDPFE